MITLSVDLEKKYPIFLISNDTKYHFHNQIEHLNVLVTFVIIRKDHECRMSESYTIKSVQVLEGELRMKHPPFSKVHIKKVFQ